MATNLQGSWVSSLHIGDAKSDGSPIESSFLDGWRHPHYAHTIHIASSALKRSHIRPKPGLWSKTFKLCSKHSHWLQRPANRGVYWLVLMSVVLAEQQSTKPTTNTKTRLPWVCCAWVISYHPYLTCGAPSLPPSCQSMNQQVFAGISTVWKYWQNGSDNSLEGLHQKHQPVEHLLTMIKQQCFGTYLLKWQWFDGTIVYRLVQPELFALVASLV